MGYRRFAAGALGTAPGGTAAGTASGRRLPADAVGVLLGRRAPEGGGARSWRRRRRRRARRSGPRVRAPRGPGGARRRRAGGSDDGRGLGRRGGWPGPQASASAAAAAAAAASAASRASALRLFAASPLLGFAAGALLGLGAQPLLLRAVDAGALADALADRPRDDRARADRVVVAGDHVVDAVRVAVGVDQAQDASVQAVCGRIRWTHRPATPPSAPGPSTKPGYVVRLGATCT